APSVRLPELGPDAVVPTCYNEKSGAWRVVAPWGRFGSTAGSSCRPPSPWDSLNVPASGWSKQTCNVGGAFECGRGELFTEIQIRGPQGPAGIPGPVGPVGR